MATIAELAPRVLRKLTVLAPGEDAPAEDLVVALQKLRAAHASLGSKDLVRWTLNDIPAFAEEPYVAMATFLAGPEFTKPVPVDLWAYGMSEIEQAIRLAAVNGPVATEYF